MKSSIVAISLCLLSLFFSACHNNTKFEEQIKQMMMHPIKIQAEDLCLVTKKGCIEDSLRNSPFTMVYYIDSTQCTSCTLNAAEKWSQELLPLINTGMLKTMVIVHPPKKEQKFMATTYEDSELMQPIWMDTCGIFISNNPHIPDNKLFHSFIIDSQNNIVLIGNPATNSKLMQLATDITKGNIEAKP